LRCALKVSWRYAPDGVGHGDFLSATTADISAAGSALVVPRELKSGTQLEIAFEFKRAGRVALIGTITRPSQPKPSGKFVAGVAFRAISQTQANAIRDFIASRQDGQRKRSIADNID
jgi:c-di-GMP-binding flagellar brake protein YcgR